MPIQPDSSGSPPPHLTASDGIRIAYHKTPGREPGLVFLGGFMSDMSGTKATALERYARARGQGFLRFDYRGHGESSGEFAQGTIGAWRDDAVLALDRLTAGPQLLIGSSMGAWIMLLTALARPDRVAALVGIAAAPDFTEDLMWDHFSPEIRARIEREGVYLQPSDYSEEPYSITRELIEDGRRHLLLRDEISLTCPVRLIHGSADEAVPWQTSLRLLTALESDDVELQLVKGGEHRLSEPRDLARLFGILGDLLDRGPELAE